MATTISFTEITNFFRLLVNLIFGLINLNALIINENNCNELYYNIIFLFTVNVMGIVGSIYLMLYNKNSYVIFARWCVTIWTIITYFNITKNDEYSRLYNILIMNMIVLLITICADLVTLFIFLCAGSLLMILSGIEKLAEFMKANNIKFANVNVNVENEGVVANGIVENNVVADGVVEEEDNVLVEEAKAQ